MRLRPLITMTIVGTLALAACGDDDPETDATSTVAAAAETTVEATAAAEVAETTEAPEATETNESTEASPAPASETTADASGDAGGWVPGADPDADAAALAWTTAFDSTLGFDAKAAFIADAEVLRPTIEAYTPAGQAVGGIALEPTAVVVTGDTAAITYDVTFAGQPAYQDQDGTLQRVDGAWVVSRDEFCGFMAAARNPCVG